VIASHPSFPFNLVQSLSNDTRIECIVGQFDSPRALYKRYLEWLIGHAWKFHPEITEAVIAIPANFSYAQRSETVAAARDAGISVLRLVHEPTAAAWAFSHLRPEAVSDVILVCDFDAEMLDAPSRPFRIIGTAGDARPPALPFRVQNGDRRGSDRRSKGDRPCQNRRH
jgi:molecular chaperone DnaK (HSP70)